MRIICFIFLITFMVNAYSYGSKKECHDDCVHKYYEEKRNAGLEWVDVDKAFDKMTPILNHYCACIEYCKSLQIPEEIGQ